SRGSYRIHPFRFRSSGAGSLPERNRTGIWSGGGAPRARAMPELPDSVSHPQREHPAYVAELAPALELSEQLPTPGLEGGVEVVGFGVVVFGLLSVGGAGLLQGHGRPAGDQAYPAL